MHVDMERLEEAEKRIAAAVDLVDNKPMERYIAKTSLSYGQQLS
jgi:hypothetical protein